MVPGVARILERFLQEFMYHARNLQVQGERLPSTVSNERMSPFQRDHFERKIVLQPAFLRDMLVFAH